MVILEDQQLRGTVVALKEFNDQRLIVEAWTNSLGEITNPKSEGTGIRVDLAVASKVQGKESRSIADVLKEVVTGLLPRNLFAAMADNDVSPVIIFSLLLGRVLTTLGTQGGCISYLPKY